LYLAQFMGAKSKVCRQLYGIKPEFSGQIVAIDMNMSRLIRLVTVEIETIRARPQYRRHGAIVAKPRRADGACNRTCSEIAVAFPFWEKSPQYRRVDSDLETMKKATELYLRSRIIFREGLGQMRIKESGGIMGIICERELWGEHQALQREFFKPCKNCNKFPGASSDGTCYHCLRS